VCVSGQVDQEVTGVLLQSLLGGLCVLNHFRFKSISIHAIDAITLVHMTEI
jgi:hypothetical protein